MPGSSRPHDRARRPLVHIIRCVAQVRPPASARVNYSDTATQRRRETGSRFFFLSLSARGSPTRRETAGEIAVTMTRTTPPEIQAAVERNPRRRCSRNSHCSRSRRPLQHRELDKRRKYARSRYLFTVSNLRPLLSVRTRRAVFLPRIFPTDL